MIEMSEDEVGRDGPAARVGKDHVTGGSEAHKPLLDHHLAHAERRGERAVEVMEGRLHLLNFKVDRSSILQLCILNLIEIMKILMNPNSI